MAEAASARKVVTILFTDITGSTALGESLDPEVLRRILTRYFDEMRTIVERHGGFVTKFIGDAVMALFGVPTRHEDDALRAVRAAAEMRSRLAELNAEFAHEWGITVAVRTGVNTGEVLVTAPTDVSALVVGDAVNVAARLEQAAEPGGVLLGDATYREVRDAVEAEPVGPLDLKGKAERVPAWRLLAVDPDSPGHVRRSDSGLVGRNEDLQRLNDALFRAQERGACEVVTVMGPAGIGKSRLISEFVSTPRPGMQVLQGRCLPYGEGITFWPVAEILMTSLGLGEGASSTDARQRLMDFLHESGADASENDLITQALTPLLGASPTGSIQEISWALRRVLERLGRSGPLVVVFDDIHWGEPTFLDLVEYLCDWVRDTPVLLICQARPELLDVRSGWLTAKPNASTLILDPLTPDQTETLITKLLGGAVVPLELRDRITEVTDGNPLYVEETLRMLAEDGVLEMVQGTCRVNGDLRSTTIPPTILALLSARLDRLDEPERIVIERASVIGRMFWWGAVGELVPTEIRPQVGGVLHALVRKSLICPDVSDIRGEDVFRFTHILVRDAAYAGIAKAERADLHERLAGWLEDKTRTAAGEYEEILAYHLEAAHAAMRGVAPHTMRTALLGERAAQHLASAGLRAFARGDMPAAVNLLTRGVALLPMSHLGRVSLLYELAFALLESGEFTQLDHVAQELRDAAAASGDLGLQADAAVAGLWIRFYTDPQAWAADAEREARSTIEVLGRLGDDRGVARGWSLLGLVGILGARFGAATDAWLQAVSHADRAGQRREALEGLTWVAAALWLGPTPASEGVARCRELYGQAHGDSKAMATALFAEGGLEADLGNFDRAHELFGRSRDLLANVGLPVWDAGALTQAIAWAYLLEERFDAAEVELRRGQTELERVGELSFLATVAALRADSVLAQGRVEEAYALTRTSQDAAGEEDVYSQVLWRSVRATCEAQRGAVAEAEALSQQALELARRTDSLDLTWRALISRGEVLLRAGRPQEARAALSEAQATARQKENTPAEAIAKEALRSCP